MEICAEVGPSAICSPAVVPNVFSDAYFSNLVEVGRQLQTKLRGVEVQTVQTAIVGLSDLSSRGRALAIASILSATPCDRLYLIFVGNTEPRRELAEPEEIKGAMRLIAALAGAGLDVVVGFCSSDMVLWKAAGATSCATGKFFNLRRFTRSRFEEPSQGGGQLSYFFEESLLAFLRESDLIRISEQQMVSAASHANPLGQRIVAQIGNSPGTPWVGLGWRQFMHWFADMEQRIALRQVDVRALLRQAEENWRTLEDADVLMEEPRNDGSWLRPWRRALAEYANH